MKTKRWIFPLLLIALSASCKDEPFVDEESQTLPKQDSSIKVIAETMVENAAKITLSYPKPFQTLNTLDNGDITFTFSPDVERGEILVFDQEPNLAELRSGLFNGCVAGCSKLAGHSCSDDHVVLSSDSDRNDFYGCLSGQDLLSQNEKKSLGRGTYYWFVFGYQENYLISHSSDVRLFTID
ncbi:MAG: hypothetical protein GY866_42340 [Proteobacteria bacterium]|nr:hypothetical protein [Pseudomonadota bacterium]